MRLDIGLLLLAVGLYSPALARDPIMVEAEGFDQIAGKKGEFKGAGSVEFTAAGDEISTELKLPLKEKFGVWVRVYFPHSAANAVYLAVDGGESIEVTDPDLGRWHWANAGSFIVIGPMDGIDPTGGEEEDELDREVEAEGGGKPKAMEDVRILNQGKHNLLITPSTTVKGVERPVMKGLGARIDKVVLYFGNQPEREEWFLGEEHALLKQALPPEHKLTAGGSVLLEAETAPRLSGVTKREEPDASGESCVEFAAKEGVATLAWELDQPRKVSVWARVYFDTANRTRGDANSLRFFLDGRYRGLVTDQDKDRWHWVLAGTFDLLSGRHLLAFRDSELPVRLDAVALCTTAEPFIQPWYLKTDPLAALLTSKQTAPVWAPEVKQLMLEAESAAQHKRIEAGAKEEQEFRQLDGPGSELSFLLNVGKKQRVQIWAKVRHPQPLALMRFYLDGRLKQALRGRGVKDKWYLMNAGAHDFDKRRHLITFRNAGGPLSIDKVYLYSGEDVRREPWFQKYDKVSFLLFSPDAPAPRYVLANQQNQLLIELEEAEDREKAPVLRCDASGGKAIEFRRAGGRFSIVAGLEQARKVQLWALTYYDARNAVAGDANSFHLSIDGGRLRSFSDTYKDEWHWVNAGTHDLSAGRHVFTFHSRELPVRLDMLALYAGEDASREPWFTKTYPFALPFGIANDLPGKAAQRISLWRVFGRSAGECRLSLSREKVKEGLRSIKVQIPEGDQPRELVLERRIPLQTSEAFTARNRKQQVDLWVHGDGSAVEIGGIYLDATGECFEGRFSASTSFSGWKLLSLNIGGDSRFLEARHEGGEDDGVADYPLRFQYLVFRKPGAGPATLHFEEPQFVRHLTCRAKLADGGGDYEVGQPIRWDLKVSNSDPHERTVDAHWELKTLQGLPVSQGTRLVRVAPSSFATLSFETVAKEEGDYCVFSRVCVDEPRRLFVSVGGNAKARFAAFEAKRAEENQAFACARMPIPRGKVAALYGAPGGPQILCDGLDVCSQEYADQRGIEKLRPVGYDLSEEAGWPELRIPPGTVAIDPLLGRYKFAEGDADRIRIVGKLHTGFGVPGCGRVAVRGDYAFLPPGEGDLTVVDIADKEHPKIASFLPTYHFFYDGLFFRDQLYFNPSRAGPQVADINDPAYPLDVRPVRGVTRVHHADETRGLLYASGPEGMGVYDAKQDPAAPRLIRPVKDCGGFIPTRDGRHAFTYCDGGRKIGVLDASDPAEPKLIARFHNDFGTTVDKEGNTVEVFARIAAVGTTIAILRSGNTITVYDISDITAPVRAGSYEFGQGQRGVSIGDVAVWGDESPYDAAYAYACDEWYAASQHSVRKDSQHGKLYVLDLTDRSAPKLIHTVTDPDAGKYNKITIQGGYAYIHDYNRGLRIFDLRDPQRPEQVSSVNSAGEGRFGGYVNNGYAYVGQTFTGSVIVIDIRDPSKPKRCGTFWDGAWTQYWNRLTGKDDCLYVLKAHGALVVDVSDPYHPTQTGEFLDRDAKPMAGCVQDLVHGNAAYLLRQNRLYSYDVSRAPKPKLVSVLPLPKPGLMKMAKSRGHLHLSGEKAFCTIDVRAPEAPRVTDVLSLDELPEDDSSVDREFGDPGGLAVNRGYAYATTGGARTTLHILDVRDPGDIRYVKLLDPMPHHGVVGWANNYHDLVASGNYLFIGNYGQIECFDISDPEMPRPVDRRAMGYQWSVGQISGEYLYVPNLKGLYIFDIPHASQVPVGKVEMRRL